MAWRKRAPRPDIVHEGDAVGRTREIYQELKRALGVPHINLVYQLYGSHPAFLELHWQAMRPAIDSAEFFEFAERIRAEAYTRVHSYFAVPDLCADLGELSPGAREEMTQVVEVFYYTDALLLLILTAQLQAFDAPIGSPRAHETSPAHPEFTEKPVVVNESSATAEQRKIFEDLRRTLSLGTLNTEFRALARFPAFFTAYWKALKPATQSPLYESMVLAIRETAWGLARELPVSIELSPEQLRESGMEDKEVSDVIRLSEFLARSMAAMVLNMAVAKIGLEGGNQRAAQDEAASASPGEPTRAA
jgi:hypothetical protein